MNNVNVVRYAQLLRLEVSSTKKLLSTMVARAGQVLQHRACILSKTREGYFIFGIPFDQYSIIWEADREELIDEPHLKTLVKRLHQELNDIDRTVEDFHEDQLCKLKSMSAQDMVRAGLWTRQPLAREIQEEVKEDL